VLAVLVLAGSDAHAQQPPAIQLPAAPYVGRTVTSVSITVEGRPAAEAALADALQTRVGEPLSMQDVRETMTHFYSLGRFADIQVEADASETGVALRFDLRPIHTVTRIEFHGSLGLSEGTLRSRIAERFGDTPPITRAPEIAESLRQLYEERGYMSSNVTAAPPIVDHDPDRATLVFNIEPGPRTRVRTSFVTGSPLESIEKIRSRLEIEPGDPYQPARLRERVDDLITSMRHRHYYRADVKVNTPATNVGADVSEVDITVDVQPGPLVTVQFAGDALPKDKIAELVPVEREGSVDEDLLEDSARAITDYLNQQGYWKAEVKPPERRESNNELTIVFTVHRGAIYHVAPGGIQIEGNKSVPMAELKPLLKVEQGDLFIASRITTIEGAIRQVYRTRGFATAEIATATDETAPGLVTPIITIKEGPRVIVRSVAITGNTSIPSARLQPVLTLAPGQPYYGPNVVRDRDALLAFYLDDGYSSADVTVMPVMPVSTPDGERADILFKVSEGPQTIVEHIFITGNLRTKSTVIRNELQIGEGQPLGLAALTESRRRLSALGLFRRIQISVISHGDSRTRDVVVTVEEAQQTTIGYGGGLQVDRVLRSTSEGDTTRERYELAPRGFFEVGRRNLGGRNRTLNLYSRLSLRPNPDENSTNPFGFSEYRVVGTYRQPAIFRKTGDLTSTAAIEQGVRTGFNFSRKGVNAEVSNRLTPTVRGSVRYSFGTTRVFDNQLIADDPETALTVDRVFPQVRLSAFSGALSRDTRDDPLEPKRGTLLVGDATFAIRALGSEVGFGKTFVQGFVYRNIGRPGLIVAAGARLGLARALLRFVDTTDANGNPVSVPVRDLPASERFFAGGDSTIRGYALDSVGVPETITPTGFPKGGDATIILNAELRAHLFGNFGGVVFMDGGNVFARAADLDLTRLRGSVGFGGRYISPIGPIRVDVGFKLDRRILGTQLEPRYAIHLSIGQAF
jgi:outer membrane protein insertion porin family